VGLAVSHCGSPPQALSQNAPTSAPVMPPATRGRKAKRRQSAYWLSVGHLVDEGRLMRCVSLRDRVRVPRGCWACQGRHVPGSYSPPESQALVASQRAAPQSVPDLRFPIGDEAEGLLPRTDGRFSPFGASHRPSTSATSSLTRSTRSGWSTCRTAGSTGCPKRPQAAAPERRRVSRAAIGKRRRSARRSGLRSS
jgi:hypothetical protein